MKTTKFSYVLFSLAIIAALVFAAIPLAPAHAMSASSTSTSLSAVASGTSVHGSVWVCENVVKWIHGYRVTVRVCHRVHKPDTK